MTNHKPMSRSETFQFGEPVVRLEVQDFGPLRDATVQLRPLTVFVGPSNTGKTYLSLLIYALHNVFAGFPRIPLPAHRYMDFDMPPGYWKSFKIAKETLEEIRKVLTQKKQIRLSELPNAIYQELIDINKPESSSSDLLLHLWRCFEVELNPELIRQSSSSTSSRFKLSLNVSDLSGDLWQFTMKSSSNQISENGSIQDVFVQESNKRQSSRINDRLIQLLRLIDRGEEIHSADWHELLLFLINPDVEHQWGSSVFYLPAVRGGIIQSHRIIASALVGRSTRAGLEPIQQIPTLPGPVADFIQTLIQYDERQTSSRLAVSEQMEKLAKDLEKKVLSGDILADQSTIGGYPEFVYRPQGTTQNIRLSRASSMVSELVPVVLLIRGSLKPGDTLIIEEPEAHLHPAAQTQMAKTLAALVRAGVRLVVTTHSDWLLQEISNLVRVGELRQAQGEVTQSEDDSVPWLDPQDVGVWLFKDSQDGNGATVQEIPFDQVDGLEPKDYAEVAESLYNRSAELQNQLEDARAQGKRSDG